MTTQLLQSFFMWCSIINIGMLMLLFFIFVFCIIPWIALSIIG